MLEDRTTRKGTAMREIYKAWIVEVYDDGEFKIVEAECYEMHRFGVELEGIAELGREIRSAVDSLGPPLGCDEP